MTTVSFFLKLQLRCCLGGSPVRLLKGVTYSNMEHFSKEILWHFLCTSLHTNRRWSTMINPNLTTHQGARRAERFFGNKEATSAYRSSFNLASITLLLLMQRHSAEGKLNVRHADKIALHFVTRAYVSDHISNWGRICSASYRVRKTIAALAYV